MGATLTTELFAVMPARVGLLAEVAGALGDAGINIVAIGAYDKAGNGEFYLLTDENQRAAEVLRGMGAAVEENSAVVVDVDDHPGALAQIASAIADAKINVDWVYATTNGVGREMVVFKTSDNEAVTLLLNAN